MAAATPTVRIESREGLLTLSGPLIFDTVPDVLQRSSGLLPAAGCFAIDLGAVTHADSAALALLIEWRRLARERGCTLDIRSLPAQLRALAAATGLETLVD